MNNSNNILSPIVLLVYNRPWHTRQTIEALKKNSLASESELFVFSDGPKNSEDEEAVNEVRRVLKTISGFKRVKIVERSKNIGLANSVISGITEIINKHGRVIVLEDDIVTSPFFLSYMNQALDMYKDHKEVGSVNSFLHFTIENSPETFFINLTTSWGWGTWGDRWELFNKDAAFLYKEIRRRGLVRRFGLNNSYPYFQMLKGQIKGLNDSWAICWYASLFLEGKLDLFYNKNLIRNIGQDGSGIHCGTDLFKDNFFNKDIGIIKFKHPVEDCEARGGGRKTF